MKSMAKKILSAAGLVFCIVTLVLLFPHSVPEVLAQEETDQMTIIELLDAAQQSLAVQEKDLQRKKVNNTIRLLKKEIARREKNSSGTNCAVATEDLYNLLDFRLLEGTISYLPTFYNHLEAKITNRFEPLNKLIKDYETLKVEAAAAGALVPDDIWKIHKQSRGKGVLIKEMLADSVLAAKIDGFRKRQAQISTKWLEERLKYHKEIVDVVAEANEKWDKNMSELAALYARYNPLRQKVKDDFNARTYEYCLGEIVQRGGIFYSSEPNFDYPSFPGTRLTDIPGMAIGYPPLAEIKAAYKDVIPFTVPYPQEAFPPLPPGLHFYKDAGKAPQRFAARAEARLAGERYMFVAEVVEGPRYICEVASQYAPWNIAKGLVHPLRHFTDSSKSWDQVLYNVGKEYTWDMAEGVLKAGVELIEEGYNGSKAAGETFVDGLEGVVNSPQGALDTITGVFQGADKALGRINAALEGANPMYDPEKPGPDASLDEWLRYTNELNGRAVSAEVATKKVKDATKWYKEHVVDNANRALVVYLAARTGAEAYQAAGGGWVGALKASQTVTGTDILEQVHGNLKGIKQAGKRGFEKFKKTTGKIKTVIKKVRTAKKILEHPKMVDKKTLKLAEESSNLEKVTEKLREKEKLEEKINEKTENRLNDLQEAQRKAAERKDPFEKTDEIDLGGDKKLEVGQKIGSGKFKDVFEHPDKNKVVQVINDQENVLRREGLGSKRLKESGVDTVQVYEEKVLANGKAIREVERVDPKSIGESILKEKGKFNAEQQAAVTEALQKINNRGYIWTDPNPGNFAFFRDEAGRLKIKVIDTDGIIKIDNVVKEKGASLGLLDKDFNSVSLDLTKEADIARLQKIIAVGDERLFGSNSMLSMANNDTIAKHLATEEFTGTDTTVPRSIGTLSEAIPDSNKLTANRIDAALEDGARNAVSESLEKDTDFQNLKKKLNAEEQADRQAAETLAKAEQKLEPPDERLAKKEEQLRKEAAENIVRRQRESARAGEPFVEERKLTLADGKELKIGSKIGEGSIKDVYAGKNPDEVIQIYKGNKEDAIEALNREVITDMRLDRAGVPFVKTKDIMFTKDGKIVKVVERINPENELGKVLRKQDGMFNREQTAAILELRDKVANAGMVGTDMSPANLDFIRDKTGRLQARVIDKDALVNVDELIRDRIRDGKETTITIKNTKKVKVDGRDRIQLVKGEEKFDLTRPEDIKRLQNLAMFGSNGELKGAYGVGTARQLMKELKPDSFDVLPVWGGTGAYRLIVPDELVSSSPAQLEGMLEQGRKTALAHEITTGSLKEKNEALQKAKAEQEKLERERRLYLSNYKKQGEEKVDIPGVTTAGGSPLPGFNFQLQGKEGAGNEFLLEHQ